MQYTLSALFETQPLIALDAFIRELPPYLPSYLFNDIYDRSNPLEEIDSTILQQWADQYPDRRYPLLGECLNMFGIKGEEVGLAPQFLKILALAPDKRLFLGNFHDRLQPRSWSGSLADILSSRKTQVMKLAEHEDEEVRCWVADSMPGLNEWIESQRVYDRAREESFE